MRKRLSLFAALVALGVSSLAAQQPRQGGGQQGEAGRGGNQQARDRGQIGTPQGTSAIAGRVLTADAGRPVKRARVTASGGGRGMRATVTDDQGRFVIADLAAGSYTVTASKTGFVDAIYGQRRALQPGMPIALGDGQAASGVDLRLTRGGVITGHVGDEDGEPLARALVTVQRYQYVRGERQLTPAGADQTDDRGQYRVFGLPPGEYYISASTTGLGELIGRGLQQLAAGIGGGRGGRGGPGGPGLGAPAAFGATDPPESTGYAPTYYPGVVSATEAGRVNVGPGQEVGGIDFQIQLVPLATVSGIVSGVQDIGNVVLVPQNAGGGLGALGGQTFNGRVQQDGGFQIGGVPPGRYTAVARAGGRSDDPRMAMQTVLVNGQNVDGVLLVLQPGVSVSGNITVESSGTPSPSDYSVFRVDVPDADPLPGLGGGPFGGGRGGAFGTAGRVEKNGSFTVPNLQPGRHYIRVTGGGQWTLKSVFVGGSDAADVAFELKPGQNVDNVTVVLTDRATELAGTVRDAGGSGGAALTVIAFSTDPQFWRAQSRRIATSGTGATGAYRIRGLPAGDYLVIAVDDVEQGEWFDPAYLDSIKDKSTHVSLSDGETKTLDLRGPS